MPRAMLFAVLGCLIAGCGSDEPQTLDSPSGTERAELSVVDYAGLKARLEKHRGKVVVLAAWSVRQEGGGWSYG